MDSKVLDLQDPSSYRDLSKPIQQLLAPNADPDEQMIQFWSTGMFVASLLGRSAPCLAAHYNQGFISKKSPFLFSFKECMNLVRTTQEFPCEVRIGWFKSPCCLSAPRNEAQGNIVEKSFSCLCTFFFLLLWGVLFFVCHSNWCVVVV